MKDKDLRLGNWVLLEPNNTPVRITALNKWKTTTLIGVEGEEGMVLSKSISPVPLTETILNQSGWIKIGRMWCLKEKVRLGWDENLKEFVIGFTRLPRPVQFVHELQNIYEICDIPDNIVIAYEKEA